MDVAFIASHFVTMSLWLRISSACGQQQSNCSVVHTLLGHASCKWILQPAWLYCFPAVLTIIFCASSTAFLAASGSSAIFFILLGSGTSKPLDVAGLALQRSSHAWMLGLSSRERPASKQTEHVIHNATIEAVCRSLPCRGIAQVPHKGLSASSAELCVVP